MTLLWLNRLWTAQWSCDDLETMLRLFAKNLAVINRSLTGWTPIAAGARIVHWLRRNTISGSRRNIEAHYDLGNDFFRLFLDETMMYSSAVFEDSSMTLSDAATAKIDRICRRLNLQPGQRVMEIGTGWGGFARHAAQHYGCHVTTTTISKEQHAFAQQRIRECELEDRVTLLLEDYRTLKGQYDRLVSIEMIEAVGHEFLEGYFGKCASLLKPDGLMLIQGITMPDQRYAAYLKTVDFIQKYIFPGGCLPSIGTIQNAVASETDLRLLLLEDIAPHYARTLQAWRSQFHSRIEEVRAQGYDERFIRMWEYYLCYCIAGFEERVVGTAQLLFAKPESRHDPIRPLA